MSQTNPWSKAGGENTAENGSAPGAAPSPPASTPTPAPKVKKESALVKMVRETPMFPGGPVTADVAKSEVAHWLSNDWKVAS